MSLSPPVEVSIKYQISTADKSDITGRDTIYEKK